MRRWPTGRIGTIGVLVVALGASLFGGCVPAEQPRQLVSVNGAGDDAANRASTQPVFSPDGTKIAFRSLASDLGPADNNLVGDVYVRDLVANTTSLVSVNAAGTNGGNNDSSGPVFSPDSKKIAFTTYANNLGPSDTFSFTLDVYVRDLTAGTTSLVSSNSSGTGSGNSDSYNPLFSPDGTKIAFVSLADNLGPIDSEPGREDIYLRDLTTGTTTLVSTNAGGTDAGNGGSADPVFSPDSTRVAFSSSAPDLAPLDTNGNSDVFVRNLSAATTTLVSMNGAGTGSTAGGASEPTFNAAGDKIGFVSHGGDFGPADTNSLPDVYVRNLATHTTGLASVNATGTNGGNRISTRPVFAPNDDRIAFESSASNLGPTDHNVNYDVYVRNLGTATTTLVSRRADGTNSGNGASTKPVFSPDGTRLGFDSTASNLGPADSNECPQGEGKPCLDVYVANLATGVVQLVSAVPDGSNGGNDTSTGAVFKPNSQLVAFVSLAENFGVTDTNAVNDIYLLTPAGGPPPTTSPTPTPTPPP